MEKDLIEYIAKSLVDDPSAVSVNETEGEKGMVLQLKVAESDIGKEPDREKQEAYRYGTFSRSPQDRRFLCTTQQ